MDEAEILKILAQKSRDNGRTPVQWNDGPNAGFTTGTPWIRPADNYKEINAEQAAADPDSIFHHYRKLIQLRKEYDLITTGRFELLAEDDLAVFAYVRDGGAEKLLVVNNFFCRGSGIPAARRGRLECVRKPAIAVQLCGFPGGPATYSAETLRICGILSSKNVKKLGSKA